MIIETLFFGTLAIFGTTATRAVVPAPKTGKMTKNARRDADSTPG
jgi:hypothetical protein